MVYGGGVCNSCVVGTSRGRGRSGDYACIVGRWEEQVWRSVHRRFCWVSVAIVLEVRTIFKELI
jgi:hypothetical protein